MKVNDGILDVMLESAKELVEKNNCVNDSNFSVVASLLTSSGKIYLGHNIENQGLQSTCAERTAFSKALSEGEKEFVAILVICSFKEKIKYEGAWPCGYCREFMSQYVSDEFEVYSLDENGKIVFEKFSDLKPHGEENFKDKVILKTERIEVIKNCSKKFEVVDDNDKSLIELAMNASKNTNKYFQKEGAILVCYNEKNEKVYYTGSTQTDNRASIIRAPKVALLKALTDGVTKFEKVICIKNNDSEAQTMIASYDVVQLFYQYASEDFVFETVGKNMNKYSMKLKEMLPHGFKM